MPQNNKSMYLKLSPTQMLSNWFKCGSEKYHSYKFLQYFSNVYGDRKMTQNPLVAKNKV